MTGDTGGEARTHAVWARWAGHIGDEEALDGFLAEAERSHREAEASGPRPRAWSSIAALALVEAGIPERAHAFLDVADAIPDPPVTYRAEALATRGRAHLASGRLPKARPPLDEAVRILEDLPLDRAWRQLELARVLRDLSLVPEARSTLLEAQEAAQRYGAEPLREQVAAQLAQLRMDEGLATDAERTLDPLPNETQEHRSLRVRLSVGLTRAEVALARGDVAEARRRLVQPLEWTKGGAPIDLRMRTSTLQARVAEDEVAREGLELVRERAAERGLIQDELTALLALADQLREEGHQPTPFLNRIRDRAQRRGLPRLGREAAKRLEASSP